MKVKTILSIKIFFTSYNFHHPFSCFLVVNLGCQVVLGTSSGSLSLLSCKVEILMADIFLGTENKVLGKGLVGKKPKSMGVGGSYYSQLLWKKKKTTRVDEGIRGAENSLWKFLPTFCLLDLGFCSPTGLFQYNVNNSQMFWF